MLTKEMKPTDEGNTLVNRMQSVTRMNAVSLEEKVRKQEADQAQSSHDLKRHAARGLSMLLLHH